MIQTIQIQTIDRCNAKCIVCPHKYIYHDGHEFTYSDLVAFNKEVRECQEAGLISEVPCYIMQFQNEPLCDKKIFDKIRFLKNTSDCVIKFYSNGLLFEKYKEQICGSRIDGITYSNYGDTLEQWIHIANIKISQTKFDEMKAAVKYIKKERGLRIWEAWRDNEMFDFSTRAGLTKCVDIKDKISGCEWGRPWKWLHIDARGNIVLCCQDWKGETTFGNVKQQPLKEILTGGRYKDIMEKAEGKKSDYNFICKRCKFGIGE